MRRPRGSHMILVPEDEERWLDPEMTDPDEIVSLLRPYPAERLVARVAETS